MLGGVFGRRAFQKFAEPWMAEPKRHMDVPKERFLESPPPKDSFPSIRGQSKGICNVLYS